MSAHLPARLAAPLVFAALLAFAACDLGASADPAPDLEAGAAPVAEAPAPGCDDPSLMTPTEYVGFVTIGHTNARGAGDSALSRQLSPPLPNAAFEWRAPTNPRFATLRDPVADWSPIYRAGTGSLYPAFARSFVGCSEKGIVIAARARGGSKLVAAADPIKNWDPFSSADLFGAAVTASHGMTTEMASRWGAQNVAFGGWIVWLGGVDRFWLHGVPDDAPIPDDEVPPRDRVAVYRRTWRNFLREFDRQVASQIGGKVYVIQEGDFAAEGGPPYTPTASAAIIRRYVAEECALYDFCSIATDTLASLRDPYYYKEDGRHFNQNGLSLIGRTAGAPVGRDWSDDPN